jgi:hypothetical protein
VSRTISDAARAAIFAQETSTVVCVLLAIDHGELIDTLRFVNNTKDVTYGGYTWTAMPFEIALPTDSEDMPPRAQLRIDNVDRTVVTAIRSISSAPLVQLSVAIVNAVDDVDVEVGPITMTLTDVSYDAYTVQGELSFQRIMDEGVPGMTMTPNGFPGLWESRPEGTDWPGPAKKAPPTAPVVPPRGWHRYGRWVPKVGEEP